MGQDKVIVTAGKSTDAAEGDRETIEESLKTHEGRGSSPKKKVVEVDRRNMDAAEGERETVEASLKAHERKGE